jgi:hypothetical protein
MRSTPDEHDSCIDPGCDLDWRAHTAEQALWCTAHAAWISLHDPHTEAELGAEAAMGVPVQDRLDERRREFEWARDILFPDARGAEREAER